MDTNEGKQKGLLWSIIVIVIFVAAFVVWSHSAKKTAPIQNEEASSLLPGMQTGNTPWIAETSHLAERLAALGLPALSEEGTVLHIHQHLDIFVDDEPVSIPPYIGINEDAGFISQIHVHDTSGIIHVESPTVQTFTLGQFFDIWGVQLAKDCIGGYCNSGDKTLKAYTNGVLYTGDPRDIVLTSHEEIVLAYGSRAELPTTIPSEFTFPDGY